MTEKLNILTSHKDRSALLLESPTSSGTVFELIASDGSFLVFNDGGPWVDDSSAQMIDNLTNSLVFGESRWGAFIVVYYRLGRRFIESDDQSLNVRRI